jgi:hypothetical protein
VVKVRLTAICEPVVFKMRDLNISQTYVPPRPVTLIAYPFLSRFKELNNKIICKKIRISSENQAVLRSVCIVSSVKHV